jgi:hypothetical protein
VRSRCFSECSVTCTAIDYNEAGHTGTLADRTRNLAPRPVQESPRPTISCPLDYLGQQYKLQGAYFPRHTLVGATLLAAMDPLSALQIVCATLQFVDFGVEIITTAREVYKSESGISARYAELQDRAERLTSITSTFSDPILTDNSKVDAGMKEIVCECKEVEIQLRTLLIDLKLVDATSSDRKLVGQAVRVFRSVVKSSKTLAKASKITELAEKMAVLRTEVHSYILYMLK